MQTLRSEFRIYFDPNCVLTARSLFDKAINIVDVLFFDLASLASPHTFGPPMNKQQLARLFRSEMLHESAGRRLAAPAMEKIQEST